MRVRAMVRLGLAAFLLAGMLVAARADAATQVYARVGPPAPVVEVRTVAPGARYVWIPGYHTWNGAAYVWAPGRWALPPHAHAVWAAPRWVHERRGWYLVAGHWR